MARRFLGTVLGPTVLGPLLACTPAAPTEPVRQAPRGSHRLCPTDQQRETRAPDIADEHLELDSWLRKLGDEAADKTLLSEADIARMNDSVLAVPGAWRDIRDEALASKDAVQTELAERMDWMSAKLTASDYVEDKPGAMAEAAENIAASEPLDEYRIVTRETQLFCVPTTIPIYTPPRDPEFNRNHCASLHPGEAVRVLRSVRTWHYARSPHSVGWLQDPAWSDAIAVSALAFDGSNATVITADDDVTGLRMGTWLPDPEIVSIEAGPSVAHLGPLPFTRRNLLRLAFAELDAPYGWGGRSGGRDCSRFLYDLFAVFGIRLARHSAVQAKLGTVSVDLSSKSEAEKRTEIRAAAQRGAVLLYMPGHIMLYLGHDEHHDYAISSLSEYLTPCEGGEDTVHRLDRVTVTTLDVGRGSSRTAFIERINRIAVFGRAP